MDAVGMVGLAASISLLSGWRLYLCAFAVGLAMRFGWVPLPAQLHSLDVLANPWVIGVAGVGALAEFFADKVMWIDSAWDTVHTLIRPVGAALLSLAIVDPKDGAWQVAVLLLGGGAALLTHGAKAGTRAAVNVSPEPFSNIAVSSGEDVVTTGLLVLVLAHPAIAGAVALVIAVLAVWLILTIRKFLRQFSAKPKPPVPAGGAAQD